MSIRLIAACLVLLAAFGQPGRAAAEEVISVATTSGSEGAPLFVAAEEGFFAQHGLSVKPVVIALMPNVPAAIMSGSVQMGFITATTFLQAVDGGLDLVAVSGGSVTSHQSTNTALIVSPTSNIHTPQDLVGHKLGVPGLGAYMDVMVRYWLGLKGVDFHKVQFIEVSFPTMRDLLKAGTVDGVVALDPFKATILDSGTGVVLANFLTDVPEGRPIAIYVANRAWAEANRDALTRFRAAIAQGMDFTRTNPDKAREDLGAHVKLPPALVKTTDMGVQVPGLTAEQLGWWVDVMHQQGLLGDKFDVAHLVMN